MARRKIATIVSEKIHPFSLNEKGKAGLAKMAIDDIKQFINEVMSAKKSIR